MLVILNSDLLMLKNINPVETLAWKKLAAHFAVMQKRHLKALFAEDPNRFARFSLKLDDILVDFSKNLVDETTVQLLLELARETDLPAAIEKMFTGDKINVLENRAVLHTALRNRSNTPVYVDGQDVMPEVNKVLEQVKHFSEQIRTGTWK